MNTAIHKSDSLSPELMHAMTADRRAIEAALESITSRLEGRISQVATRLIRTGGKRVRPHLSCSILRVLGHDPLPHMELIACAEIIHAASLLHDDVIDSAHTRRGQVATHILFDSRTAVMAGDLLLATAVETLADSGSATLVQLAARAVSAMTRGQAMEAEHAFNTAVPLERLLTVNRLKTAALFAYSAESAAVLAGASPAIRRDAERYGELIGEAFQLVDDLLDWTGKQGETGKRPGQDLQEGKITMPLFLAIQDDPTLQQAVKRYWCSREEDDDREACRQLVLRQIAVSGALEETLKRARHLADAAAAELQHLPLSPWRDELERLACHSVDRIA